MVFEVKFSVSAVEDLEKAIIYYDEISRDLSKKFHSEFEDLISVLEKKPYFEIKYSSVRTCNLKSFPYLIHFTINETTKKIIIIAVVFGKQQRTDFSNRI